jgi:hypothetical protein
VPAAQLARGRVEIGRGDLLRPVGLERLLQLAIGADAGKSETGCQCHVAAPARAPRRALAPRDRRRPACTSAPLGPCQPPARCIVVRRSICPTGCWQVFGLASAPACAGFLAPRFSGRSFSRTAAGQSRLVTGFPFQLRAVARSTSTPATLAASGARRQRSAPVSEARVILGIGRSGTAPVVVRWNRYPVFSVN